MCFDGVGGLQVTKGLLVWGGFFCVIFFFFFFEENYFPLKTVKISASTNFVNLSQLENGSLTVFATCLFFMNVTVFTSEYYDSYSHTSV